MSGLARLFHSRGWPVAGIDAVESEVTASLRSAGIPVTTGEGPCELSSGTGVVIASAAVRPDHPLVLDAHRQGIPVFSYAEALGGAMAGMTGVAVAGTHGKSTTSAMLSAALIEGGLDPTVIVGASCPHLRDEHGRPTGFRVGASKIPQGELAGRSGLLVAEACEYNRSFHALAPHVASISSIEADHLDIYGSIDAVVEAFREFASLIPPASTDPSRSGRLLIGHDTAHRRDVTRGLDCEVSTIGFNPAADWHVGFDAATGRLTISTRGRAVAEFTAPMPGEHNAMNAATAFVLADLLGVDREAAVHAIAGFKGVHRRLERLGERPVDGGAVTVYDDYGHHPTEVEMTIRAIRQRERLDDGSGRRLIVVFQPHQHSRTRFFLDEFANAFGQADAVIVPHIYFVRDSEAEKQRVSAEDLVDRLRARGVRAMHSYPFDAIIEQAEDLGRPGDVLLVMGAGPVWQVAHGFMASAARVGATP